MPGGRQRELEVGGALTCLIPTLQGPTFPRPSHPGGNPQAARGIPGEAPAGEYPLAVVLARELMIGEAGGGRIEGREHGRKRVRWLLGY